MPVGAEARHHRIILPIGTVPIEEGRKARACRAALPGGHLTSPAHAGDGGTWIGKRYDLTGFLG